MKRERRGVGERLLVKGSSIRPADWKIFLCNIENKEKLLLMLLDVWSADSFAHHLQDRKVKSLFVFLVNFMFCFGGERQGY